MGINCKLMGGTSLKFSNSYINLGDAFYQHSLPTAVATPKLLLWNEQVADDLQIAPALCKNASLLEQYFSGNQIPEGADPIALAYSGHQFGHFNPYLGDGRAHLLGEIIDKEGQRQDIQLKGSGQTDFSRQGDGRCAIGPAIREYMMSEAMHALNVPTSRCLAVVATGENVYRETSLPGAVVTRVASSHIRIGTFQYFAARQDIEALASLTDYAISRHFPEIDLDSDLRTLTFLEQVIEKQITLIVAWMRVGFIHGVMNTDNSAISGETIDFGPCAMMGSYHQGTVYSSIDKQGRYAFGNQPHIAQWNMARLAECLLPLIDEDDDKALAKVEPLIMKFSTQFQDAYYRMLGEKLGITNLSFQARSLADELLALMQENTLDYTQTFNLLTLVIEGKLEGSDIDEQLNTWFERWKFHLSSLDISDKIAATLMRKNNPVVIPRNHHVEAILKASESADNMSVVDEFINVMRSPYTQLSDTEKFQDLPSDGDLNYHTFCGT